MALNEYLKRVANLLDGKQRRCNKEKKCLHTVLAKLKSREDLLDAQLCGHPPENVRKAIERERKVVFAQWRKGLKMLRELEGNKDRDTIGSRYDSPHLAG